jgi:hypothetical protein
MPHNSITLASFSTDWLRIGMANLLAPCTLGKKINNHWNSFHFNKVHLFTTTLCTISVSATLENLRQNFPFPWFNASSWILPMGAMAWSFYRVQQQSSLSPHIDNHKQRTSVSLSPCFPQALYRLHATKNGLKFTHLAPAPCRVADCYRRFGNAWYIHFPGKQCK